MQVSQTDIVTLESKWSLSVLRIRHCPQVQQGVLPVNNPNETTLILNLICDQVLKIRIRRHFGFGILVWTLWVK